jgi:exodeoxyribonuclease VII large subunit
MILLSSAAAKLPVRQVEVASAKPNVAEFSVSELSNAVKRALEDGFGYIRVRGEISGYRGPHSSGHAYFALKDDKAKIEAVIWKGVMSKLRFRPEEGMEVIAQGRITTYPGSSKYQIMIDSLEPAGVGALMALLEERKRKLAAEGLFGDDRKRKLPFFPRVVGIVTSPTGAVIRDMLHGFEERCPTHVIVWPVRVQGETSAAEVANAIRGFNALLPGGPIPRPDVLIIARGGGSLEDLWGFNEEIVVRAAAASTIPLISAVGHETDWTLIDLVSDARAPTPTKAAEWAVPKYSELIEQTESQAYRLNIAVRRTLESRRTELRAASRGLPRLEDLIALPRQRFDGAAMRLDRALLANTRAHGMRLARVSGRLHPRLLTNRLERTRDRLESLARRAADGLARTASQRRARLERVGGRLNPEMLRVRLSRGTERLAALQARSVQAMATSLTARRQRLDSQAQMLSTLSYKSVLGRGYALVRDAEGRAVRSVGQVIVGNGIDIEVGDGRIAANVTSTDTTPGKTGATPVPPLPPLSKPRAPAARSTKAVGSTGPQGSLFDLAFKETDGG